MIKKLNMREEKFFMELFEKYREEILEINSGKRLILIIRTNKQGEQFVLTSEKMKSGIINIQKMFRGEVTDTYTQKVGELILL